MTVLRDISGKMEVFFNRRNSCFPESPNHSFHPELVVVDYDYQVE